MKKRLIEYTQEVCTAISKTDFDAFAQITQIICDTKKTGATIFTIGNGGSCATASHICNDLLKGCALNGVGFKAECLSDSNAIVTCLANDFDYDSIYSIQLKTKGRKGDVLICYSGSGNSGNILNAVKTAKEIGMTIIGFTGRDGGELAKVSDVFLIAQTDSMEQIEDLHMVYAHAISDDIQRKLGLI